MRLLAIIIIILSLSKLAFSQEVPVRRGVIKVRKANPEQIKVKTEKLDRSQDIVKLPILVAGELGLLLTASYVDEGVAKRGRYVLFNCIVGRSGKVEKIEFLESNDIEFKRTVEKLLLASEWLPAENRKGETVEFQFKQQIAIKRISDFHRSDF